MISGFRKLTEKLTAETASDATDKARIKEVEEAAHRLLKSLQGYAGKFAAANGAAAELYGDLANLYPANEKLSGAVASLSTSGAMFTEASTKTAAQLQALLGKPVTEILAKTKALSALVDERVLVRAEINHYTTKVTKLANQALEKADKQGKAESNQEKLLRNQRRFQELESDINSNLATLNGQIAELTNRYLTAFLELQLTHANSLVHCYSSSLATIPAGDKEAAPESDYSNNGAAAFSMSAFTATMPEDSAPAAAAAAAGEQEQHAEAAAAEYVPAAEQQHEQEYTEAAATQDFGSGGAGNPFA